VHSHANNVVVPELNDAAIPVHYPAKGAKHTTGAKLDSTFSPDQYAPASWVYNDFNKPRGDTTTDTTAYTTSPSTLFPEFVIGSSSDFQNADNRQFTGYPVASSAPIVAQRFEWHSLRDGVPDALRKRSG
jgi:hypothetical protein